MGSVNGTVLICRTHNSSLAIIHGQLPTLPIQTVSCGNWQGKWCLGTKYAFAKLHCITEQPYSAATEINATITDELDPYVLCSNIQNLKHC